MPDDRGAAATTDRRAALQPGAATGCGSLPHADPAEALRLLRQVLPDLLPVPSLPNRHPAEGMLGQAAAGMGGVTVERDGSLAVDPGALDPGGVGDGPDELPAGAFGAALHVLDGLAATGWQQGVKLQVTGPVTLGTALVAAGAPPRAAFAAAAVAVAHRSRALVAATRRRLPSSPLLVVVDEPAAGAASLGVGPLAVEEVVDLVSGALAAVEGDAATGVHCCATVADWGALLRAGPDLLSLPVESAASLRPGDLGPFLERGGWVAWGAVPTGGPLAPVDGGGATRLWRALAARWHALADGGVDPVLLRRRALVTPACGLARHDERQAELALHLTAELGARIAAGAARSSTPDP